jgi:hypothetical protein
MFINPTVFILGAGASWHYGYPTGEKLVGNIILMATRLRDYCRHRLQSGQTVQVLPVYIEQRLKVSLGGAAANEAREQVAVECDALISRLNSVQPLLIDHFLAWNESLQPIGKLMIAAAILECEAAWVQARANQNRRLDFAASPIRPTNDEINRLDIKRYQDQWYRFIVHKFVCGCEKSADLFKNNVHFVTFNYDCSLEHYLYQALNAIDILSNKDVTSFLSDGRIIHVYGSVHRGIPTDADIIQSGVASALGSPFSAPLNFDLAFAPRKMFLDQCLSASENLRTIDPIDKEAEGEALETARSWISDAGVVYMLGYGFDRNNNRRIGIEPILDNSHGPSGKCVMFTNFGDMDTINKRTSKLFFGNYGGFLEQKIHGDPFVGNYVEKSTRNVYDALEQDFDALENELIGSTKLKDVGL